jgi:nitronate monooxygenase
MSILDTLRHPIVLTAATGDGDTPRLVAAASEGGGFGCLPSGYRSTEQFRADVAAARALTSHAFGVELVAGGGYVADPERYVAYALSHLPVGEPRFADHALDAKIQALLEDPVAAVSFTRGSPSQRVVDELHAAGSEVWLVAASPAEARDAAARGADAVIVPGIAALSPIRASVTVPLVAAEPMRTGAGVAAALAAGATAARYDISHLDSRHGDAGELVRALAADGRVALGDALRRIPA